MLANAEHALAIELLAGAQAIEFLAPLEPGPGVRATHDAVRRLSERLRDDRSLADDIARVAGSGPRRLDPRRRRGRGRGAPVSRRSPRAAAAAEASVPRQPAPQRRARGPDPVIAWLTGGELGRAIAVRGRLLRPRDRVELVALPATAASGARARERWRRSRPTVDALVGDLSRIRAPRGSTLNARSWQTEAPLRMLLNNLDPEVAEKPEELVVYGGSGRAARSPRGAARDRAHAAPARRRRDAARPERQAGRRLPHAPRCAARADRELAARAALGERGTSSGGSRRRV